MSTHFTFFIGVKPGPEAKILKNGDVLIGRIYYHTSRYTNRKDRDEKISQSSAIFQLPQKGIKASSHIRGIELGCNSY